MREKESKREDREGLREAEGKGERLAMLENMGGKEIR